MKTEKGINSAWSLSSFLPYFLKENNVDSKDFFDKTGIDPRRFNSPIYLANISSPEQYHAVREYFQIDKIEFVLMIFQYDMKGCLRHTAMYQCLLGLERLLSDKGLLVREIASLVKMLKKDMLSCLQHHDVMDQHFSVLKKLLANEGLIEVG